MWSSVKEHLKDDIVKDTDNWSIVKQWCNDFSKVI